MPVDLCAYAAKATLFRSLGHFCTLFDSCGMGPAYIKTSFMTERFHREMDPIPRSSTLVCQFSNDPHPLYFLSTVPLPFLPRPA